MRRALASLRAKGAPDGAAGSPLQTTFRRGFVETFALDVVARGLSAVTIVVLIRGLSVSEYAFITLFLTLAYLAGTAAGGGVRARYLREEAEEVSRGGTGTGPSFVGSLASGSVLVLVFGLATLFGTRLVSLEVGRASELELVVYATAFAIAFASTELGIAHYQAHRRFRRAGFLNVARAAAVLVVALLVTVGTTEETELAAWFVGAIAVAGLLSAAPAALRDARERPRLRALVALNVEERWLSLYFLTASAFAYVDVIVAGVLLSEHEVATLGATVRYLSIVLAAVPAIGAVLRVRTAQVDLVDSGANQRSLTLRWLRATAPPAALVVVLGVVLAPFVIPLVDGGRYPGSIPALQIFLAAAFAAYVTEPGPNILMTQRRYAWLAVAFGIAFVVNLATDVAVAPHYGVTGIAVVSATTYVLLRAAVTAAALRGAGAPNAASRALRERARRSRAR